MAEKWLAVLGLVACLGVWAGMALGPVRRARWLTRWQRVWGRVHARFQARFQASFQARWRTLRAGLKARAQRPQQARQAQQQAAETIERARRRPKVDREGNVYRPDAFNGKPDDKGDGSDKLH